MQKCNKCSRVLDLDCFDKSKQYPNGHVKRCKDCRRIASREYTKLHRKEISKYNKRWAKNTDFFRKYQENSYSSDELVEILRRHPGGILKEQLKGRLRNLYGLKKLGICVESDGVLSLTNNPLRFAFNGFYDEKEKSKQELYTSSIRR